MDFDDFKNALLHGSIRLPFPTPRLGPKQMLDDRGRVVTVEFAAIHAERPDPDALYMNDIVGRLRPEPWEWRNELAEPLAVRYVSAWSGERCVGVLDMLRTTQWAPEDVFRVEWSQGGFPVTPVPIPERLR